MLFKTNKDRKELEEITRRRAEGYILEFDYPYTPRVRTWRTSLGNGHCEHIIARNMPRYQEILTNFVSYKDSLVKIPVQESPDPREPYWTNPTFPPLDAICLYSLVAGINPRFYVEVGSGNSTKYVRRAINDHGLRTRIISIDPQPREFIDDLCDVVIRKKLEDYDLSVFADLGAEDIVFVDNSHRSFQNSDVTVVFTEVMPILGSGCVYGIHDIFLPYDYPAAWLPHFYNEQYLLMAYLLGGAAGDEIICPVHFIQIKQQLSDILHPITDSFALPRSIVRGGAFWMRRA